MNNIRNMYIHIPFCKKICTYCNFKKEILNEQQSIKYIDKICEELDNYKYEFETIYIGGGTPNCLKNNLLEKLFSKIKNISNSKTEISIELNPEFVNEEQVKLFKKYNINRFSIGVQVLNNNILRIINRYHSTDDIYKSIDLLHKYGLFNISCDFIYNLPLMKNKDIDSFINLINKKEIKHISLYSLEVKEGSILEKTKYQIDYNKEEEFLEYLENELISKTKFKKYEVSNWAIDDEYKSKHNLSYWNMNGWIGIGYGSCGYEQSELYENIGSINSWIKNIVVENDEEYYKTILIMGLRKIEGINLKINRNREAFEFYKHKLNSDLYVIENDFLKCKNINLLNSLLIDLY